MAAESREMRRRTSSGVITGYVLRLVRESIPLVQGAFAECVGVDLATVQGWESGRRPLGNVKAGALLTLKRRLPQLGGDQQLVRLLDAALDADRIIGAALDSPQRLDEHPLAGWVHTRETAHMIAWAMDGTPPPAIGSRPVPVRRGPVANGPCLPAAERTQLLGHLRSMAEAASGDGRPMLLRRQSLYLASYDRSAAASAWTNYTLHSRRDLLSRRGWFEHWTEARSIAAALARQGDPQPLRDFIARSIADDDTGEAANLNYWAYWLGATPSQTEPNDLFMTDKGLACFDPVTLMRRLTQGMSQAPTYVDLYAHSLWALLVARPWLPQADPRVAAKLAERVTYTLDGQEMEAQCRRDLCAVHYLLSEHRT